MATYKTAQALIRERHGFAAKNCWIAHILSDSGKMMRQAPNRLSASSRVHACPPRHRLAIIAALAELGMLGPILLAN